MVTHHVEAAQAGLIHNIAAAGGRYSDERWSIGLALAATLVIPIYFFGTPYWSAHYTPIRPWVWAVPGVVCMLYLFAQFWALLHSAGRSSEDIGMKDTVVALFTALSSFGTLVAMLILWFQGNYHFGPFQAMAIGTVTATTFGELIFTAWMRYLINRRYFSGVPQAG